MSIEPAAIRELPGLWRRQARLIEQSEVCPPCPVGEGETPELPHRPLSVPQALRECARDLDMVLNGQRPPERERVANA